MGGLPCLRTKLKTNAQFRLSDMEKGLSILEEKNLVISFSVLSEFPESQMKEIALNSKFMIVSPIEFCSKYYNKSHYQIIQQLLMPLKSHEQKELRKTTSQQLIFRIKKLCDTNASFHKPSRLSVVKNLPLAVVTAARFLFKAKKIFKYGTGAIYLGRIDCTTYLLDSLLRRPKYRPDNPECLDNNYRAFKYLYIFLLYFFWLKNFLEKNPPQTVIINHTVYLESGFISAYLSERYGSKIVHISSAQQGVLKLGAREKFFEKEVKESFKQYMITKRHVCHEKYTGKDSSLAVNDFRGFSLNKKRVLVFMHAISDANDIHMRAGELFRTFYEWLNVTLRIARDNPLVIYEFRIHPLTYSLYRWDLDIIYSMFSDVPSNIRLSNPLEVPLTALVTQSDMPVCVTFKGTIALEMACAGVKVVTAGVPYAPVGTFLQARSTLQYESFISGNITKEMLVLGDGLRIVAIGYKEVYDSLRRQ